MTATSRAKAGNAKTAVLTAVISLLLALVLAEIALRAAGLAPWQYLAFSNEPTLHTHDATLGWINKQGRYTIPPYTPEGDPIRITFLEDGNRSTGAHRVSAAGDIIIVGGSFTQGWAISDRDTYPWKLQAGLPAMRVWNYGTGGYGTYQSLLMLERVLPASESPRQVLYGFIDHHETRNVAPSHWLAALSRASARGHVDIPYVTLDDAGNIVRHPPESHAAFALREHLSTVTLAERAYMKLKSHGREAQKRAATQALLREMDSLSRRHGAEFRVVLLQIEEASKPAYTDFLVSNDIRYTDCARELTEDLRVPGEGHPNGQMNTFWRDCILQAIAADST